MRLWHQDSFNAPEIPAHTLVSIYAHNAYYVKLSMRNQQES